MKSIIKNNHMTIIASSNVLVELCITGTLTRDQRSALRTVMNNATVINVGKDPRDYFVRELKPHFDDVGFGGSHVWIHRNHDAGCERIAVIYINR